ncbi:MAG: MFS transporter, partial [Ignavibacteria bacterium]|nr:MFS transporter [Ignavibacteria bacterium]
LAVRLPLGEEAFTEWGWRIPFILSVLLVAMSYWIRMRLKESPLFAKLKASGKTSTAPIKDSMGNRKNWKLMILALLGATSGQAVVWYTGQFYALFFLQTVLKIDFVQANIIVAVALLLGTPLFIVFGALSDRIGRKKVMMTGCLIAAISYFPIYQGMSYFASDPQNPNVVALVILVFIQVVFVTMVYGPIAAFLVELFPASIRYTSMSLPYHLGNGWFGGFTPLIASSLVAMTGYIYAGLAFPIAVALMTFIIGSLYLKETHKVRIWDEVEGGGGGRVTNKIDCAELSESECEINP